MSESENNNQNFMDPETIRKAMEIETFKDDIYTIIQFPIWILMQETIVAN